MATRRRDFASEGNTTGSRKSVLHLSVRIQNNSVTILSGHTHQADWNVNIRKGCQDAFHRVSEK